MQGFRVWGFGVQSLWVQIKTLWLPVIKSIQEVVVSYLNQKVNSRANVGPKVSQHATLGVNPGPYCMRGGRGRRGRRVLGSGPKTPVI